MHYFGGSGFLSSKVQYFLRLISISANERLDPDFAEIKDDDVDLGVELTRKLDKDIAEFLVLFSFPCKILGLSIPSRSPIVC